MTWFGPRDNPNEIEPVREPGLTNLRSNADMNSNSISTESFSLYINNENEQFNYFDPKQFDGHVQFIGKTGELRTHVSTYKNIDIPFPITRSFFLPPHEKFLMIEFKITNPTSKNLDGILFDFVDTNEISCSNQKQYAFLNKQDVQTFMSDMTKCGQPLYFGCGSNNMSSISSFQVGSIDRNSDSNPLKQFTKNKYLLNNEVFEDRSVSIGITIPFHLKPLETKSIYTYRVVQSNWESVIDAIKRFNSQTPEYWKKYTASCYSDWLKQGLNPVKQFTTEEQQTLYENSLTIMKLALNPSTNGFVASFHPAYGYKIWARDGIFGAMILDGAEHHEEAKKFLQWISQARLREDGGFHTCYSWWTGEPVEFVDPQFDSVGEYLLAVYYHYSLTNDSTFIFSIQNRIRSIENFILNNRVEGGFIPSDYSIWEESSDGITGNPLPTSYFSFTQGTAYAGLISASYLEEKVFGDYSRSSLLKQRAEQLRNVIETKLWVESMGQYARGINSQTLEIDTRADSSSVSIIWGGATKNITRAQLHLQNIRKKLTKLNYGVARYENDPFFYDSKFNPGGREVSERSPCWPVVTMATSWAEMLVDNQGTKELVSNRLKWMVDVSAPFQIPIGEAVDSITGEFVMSSTPDCYEHSVFAWTILMHQNLISLPNPQLF